MPQVERILESRFAVDSDVLPLPGLEQGVEPLFPHDAADNQKQTEKYDKDQH